MSTARHRPFARIRHGHALARQFRRLAVWDMFRHEPRARAPAQAVASRLLAASAAEPEALLAELGSAREGLTRGQVARLRHRHGPNSVETAPPLPWWQHLWQCYRSPFNLLLTALAVVSWASGDLRAMGVITLMVMLSVGLRFVQEQRSNRAADALKAMVSNRATVLRDGAELELPIRQLVPGDVVVLAAGDMIPADLRVLAAKDLFVAQSAMTGESLPVEKFVAAPPGGANPLDCANLLFMGTNVVSGAGRAVVLETGGRTHFGALAHSLTATERAPTAFEAGVSRISWLLIRFIAVMVPLVFAINGLTKGDWLEAFLFALSVAVGLTPEMLPMIVTSTLARGAVVLSRQKVVVKRLDAIQNFGAMNVLCTDKTGTLTQDRIVLERHIDVHGMPSEEVLSLAWLNSHYQTGLRNLLDRAVLEHVEVNARLDPAANYRKVDEIPFDFQRRRMSVVVARRDEQHLLICKGAVEEVLQVCDRVRDGDGDLPLDATRLAQVHAAAQALNADGLRVVAVALREEPQQQQVWSVADETGLTLVGFVAFLDPPKESTGPALRALAAHGIELKILTGDNEHVTAKVCAQVGLEVRGVLLGVQVEALDDAALAEAAQRCNVFAKLSPAQKERIVRALRRQGRVVGYMGDGINDAAALHAADIGISVDSAVDIAKEAADIVLLEKSLLVLDAGVVEGRRTFANMLKYIRMTASSNFGNVFSVLVASAFLPFLPMLPLQLLVQNLLYDLAQTAIPFDRVDDEQLAQPQLWHAELLGRFMVWFGPVSSVFDLATFALLWFVFGAQTPAQQSLFQSGWFVEGLLSQTLIVHLIRTRRLPFVESRAAPAVLAMSVLVAAAGVFIPMGPLAPFVRMQPLPGAYFVALAAVLLGYALLAQAMKALYTRRHGWQ